VIQGKRGARHFVPFGDDDARLHACVTPTLDARAYVVRQKNLDGRLVFRRSARMTSTASTAENPVPETNPSTVEAPPVRWSLARRILFRFVFAHFVILFFPTPFTGMLPVIGDAIDEFISDSIWLPVVRNVGKYVLRLPEEVTHVRSGSGDTTYDWVFLFTSVCLAVIVAAIWSYVQRRKDNHEKLDDYFRIWLRYTLATVMIGYGIVKLVKLQFGDPHILQLVKTYGESSPMDLLWTFMGFSTPYTFFGGFMEFVPALMLFFRRTTLLGNLLLMGVLGNVVMLNFCYDVPVKIHSSHLFFMTLVIALPDMKRLFQFFVQNAPTQAVPERKKFAKPWMERGRVVAKVLFIVIVLGQQSYSTWRGLKANPSEATAPPILGVYEVTAFTRNGVDVPPSITDKTRWRYFLLSEYRDKQHVLITTMTGNKKFVSAKLDAQQKSILLEEPNGDQGFALPPQLTEGKGSFPMTLRFTEQEGRLHVLEGTIDGAAVRMELKKLHKEDFLLINRGFHWVNEFPFSP
jgi:hypothetical protein